MLNALGNVWSGVLNFVENIVANFNGKPVGNQPSLWTDEVEDDSPINAKVDSTSVYHNLSNED